MGGLEDVWHPLGGSGAEGSDLPDEPVSAGQAGAFTATVTDDAVEGELVRVTMAAMDEAYSLDARWVAHGAAMPAAGDDGLVVFDDEGEPWLVSWGTLEAGEGGGGGVSLPDGTAAGWVKWDGTALLTDPTIDAGDLGFDPATQGELDAVASATAAAQADADAAQAAAATAQSTASAAGTAATTAQGEIDAHEGLATSAHGGIVANTDPRLTDSRTPTAHAATHRLGGGDALKVHELALPTAATPMNGQKFTGLANGSAAGDSATVGQAVLRGNFVAFGDLLAGTSVSGSLTRIARGAANTIPYASDAAPGGIAWSLLTNANIAAAAGIALSKLAGGVAPAGTYDFTGATITVPTGAVGEGGAEAASQAYVEAATGGMSTDRPVCHVVRTTTHALAAGLWQTVQMSTELVDNDGMFDAATWPGRVYARTAGTYVVTAHMGFDNTGVNQTHAVRLVHYNAAVVVQGYYAAEARHGPVDIDGPSVSKVLTLNAGDFVTLEAYTGAATNTMAWSNTHHAALSMAWVGSTGNAKTPGQQVPGGFAKTTASIAVAAGGSALSITVTGDGVTPMRIDAHAVVMNAATVVAIADGATYIQGVQCMNGTGATPSVVVPAFTGSKTFHLRSTSAATFTASGNWPVTLRATWAPGYST